MGGEFRSPNNPLGSDGDNAGEGNRIAFNGGDGVRVRGGRDNAFAVGNRILNNSIFSNGNLGIDLDGGPDVSNPDADGVTANGRKDRDTGPNTLQNFPKLASATTADPGITTIKGTLNSRPRKTFFIQFFSSGTTNSAGFAEGKTFVGQITKKTNREGKLSFTLRTVLPTGENLVTATATSLDTSTVPPTTVDASKFSKAVTAKVVPQEPTPETDREPAGSLTLQFGSSAVSGYRAGLRKLLQRHRQDPHGLVVMGGPDVLLATLGRPPPLLEPGVIRVAGEVHLVDRLPQVRVALPHTRQRSVQLVVTLRLG